MKYQRENVADVLDELKPLLEQHWDEIAHFRDIALDPDFGFYAESTGVRLYTARDAGKLVGYAVFFVATNKHYRNSLQALQDILFLHPDYRRGMAGAKLIAFCDQQLRAEGCQVSYQHIKAAHNFGPLLERMGYELVDLIYARRLDHGSDS